MQLYLPLISIFLTIFTLALTAWNSWTNSKMHILMLEFEVNLRKELNGKYVTLREGDMLGERLERLEKA